jgi:hypothetical protein
MRRKLDESMPPEGYSIRCLQEPDKVYRWTEGELRYYPTGQVASSWNTAWREDLIQMDCVNIPKGEPMSMNFGSLTMSRAADGFSVSEGYSVRCLQEPSKVYRWHEGELHHYPTGMIASSWDEDWREALVELDCSSIPKGEPMSDKNDADLMDASGIVEGFDINTKWTFIVGKGFEEQTPMFDHRLFHEMINAQEVPIVRRACESCKSSHKDIYYRRLTPMPDDFDLLDTLMDHWINTDNVLNKDFSLHSTYIDAYNGVNGWTFCNYSPLVGFPRDCGPTQPVWFQWNSYTRSGGDATTHAFMIPADADFESTIEPPLFPVELGTDYSVCVLQTTGKNCNV